MIDSDSLPRTDFEFGCPSETNGKIPGRLIAYLFPEALSTKRFRWIYSPFFPYIIFGGETQTDDLFTSEAASVMSQDSSF